jgi:glycyl-tRNA synthetase beta chain
LKINLLIEIGTEELPASYIKAAAEEFSKKLKAVFEERNISYRTLNTFFTPRRIASQFLDIDDKERKKTTRIFGPPVDSAFDEEGNPTAAAVGFAESYGKKPAHLKITEKKKRKVCYLEVKEKPEKTKKIVKKILPEILSNLSFPRKMRWEESKFEFARPIRWTVILFNKRYARIKLAGVTSSKSSYGPRFSGSQKIIIKNASSYEKVMKENNIIVSYKIRRKMIEDGIKKLLVNDEGIVEDKELLDEVTNMVEYPTVFKGTFDTNFLSLPREVLITAMKEHQRYFAVFNQKKGALESVYIGVSNSMNENIYEITKGNNSVLKARLNDAKFYWDEDLKVPPAERIQELQGVEWHKDLGSLYDKTKRLVLLSMYVSSRINRGEKEVIKRGALLSKTDQVTYMVKDGKEFTKLEGIIGREYALAAKEKKIVANIISDHYLPRFPGDILPETVESAVVGLSDRFDTLVGNFLVGEEPTGSIDPFALRRCANGLIKLTDEFELRYNLENIIDKSISLYEAQDNITFDGKVDEIKERLRGFLAGRLSYYFSSIGIRYDIASSVSSVYFENIYETMQRVRILNKFKDDEDFKKLIIGQRRVSNILQDINTNMFDSVEEKYFDSNAEKKLWENYISVESEFSSFMEKHGYREALESLLSLRGYIDDFFDNCLVMTDDDEIRNNRISILVKIKKLFYRFADFSIIVFEE